MANVQNPAAPQNRTSAPANKRGKNHLYRRLLEMPQLLGIVLMILLLVASLYVGNLRALQNLVSAAEQTLDLEDLVQERAAGASNILTIANRNSGVSEEYFRGLETARDTLLEAQGVSAISQADLGLHDAVLIVRTQLQEAGLDAEEERNLQRALDGFEETGNMMRQQAREYNRLINHAREVRGGMPFRFLLPEPAEYAGAGV